MRRAARWRLVVAAGLLAAAVHAQTLPSPPASPPPPDSAKPARPTFVADTARQVTVVGTEPSDVVTRRLGLRIGAAIVVLTLTTLLLYNVRSR